MQNKLVMLSGSSNSLKEEKDRIKADYNAYKRDSQATLDEVENKNKSLTAQIVALQHKMNNYTE